MSIIRERVRKLKILVVLLLALGVLTTLGPAAAVTDGVTASATNNAKITITVSDATAAFGTTLDPSCAASDSADTVTGNTGSTGNQGCYYLWKSAGTGLTVTVKSNKSWNGTVQASENAGTSTTMTVASGVLRFSEGSEPANYSACAAATAFTTTSASWKSSIAAGANAYTHYYCLRMDWTDAPGTFNSTVTYTATQI